MCHDSIDWGESSSETPTEDFARTPRQGQGSAGASQGLVEADADAANGHDGTLPTPSSPPPRLDEPVVQPLPPQHPLDPRGQGSAPPHPGTAPTPGHKSRSRA
ncbi:hypothetical protein M3G03_12535 [Aestuariimicrobium sp. p3-SID1156]|uniref:hypothetical protein n=1 Tax=Aestuariimicrobium sp. p3-SID1156 TaxID=2916038 RepID=UPI00223AF7C5|nr:hypothetical protein [Aestuariimicrobium sp. p3-SID1156]MCT1460356.1 hypothetical protein [Aestuariimicrobium sp. p3-SID1156]